MSAHRVERPVAARAGFVAVAVFLSTASFIVTKASRDALFVQNNGIYDLPLAYMGIAALALPFAVCMLLLMRAVGPRNARVAVALGMAAVLLLFARVAKPGGGPLMTTFFMLVPLVFGVLFSAAWLLAADLLTGVDPRILARCYGAIGAASIGGGVAGGALARLLAALMTPRAGLGAGAVLLVLASIVMIVAQRRHPVTLAPGTGPSQRPTRATIATVLRQPYTALLLAVSMLAALTGALIEFQFYLTAASSRMDARASAGFFANLYLVLNGIALVIQLAIMPWLQRRIGLARNLLVLPIALLGAAAISLAPTPRAMGALLRVTEGGLKPSIHRASWEQAYLPLTRAQRGVAKLLVDGAGARVAEGIGATILFFWLRHESARGTLEAASPTWILYALLATVCAWLIAGRTLGRDVGAPAADLAYALPLPDA